MVVDFVVVTVSTQEPFLQTKQKLIFKTSNFWMLLVGYLKMGTTLNKKLDRRGGVRVPMWMNQAGRGVGGVGERRSAAPAAGGVGCGKISRPGRALKGHEATHTIIGLRRASSSAKVQFLVTAAVYEGGERTRLSAFRFAIPK